MRFQKRMFCACCKFPCGRMNPLRLKPRPKITTNPIAPQTRYNHLCKGTFEIVSKEVLWSVRGSYQTIWGPPLPNYTTFRMMAIYSGTLNWSGIIPISDPITDLDIITEFDFLPNCECLNRTFATVAACQRRTLTPPDTWSCPIWDLQMFFCWDHSHSIIHYTTNSWIFTWFDFLPNWTPFLDLTTPFHVPFPGLTSYWIWRDGI